MTVSKRPVGATYAILGGRVRLLDGAERSGLDPVLLAAAVPAEPGETALEIGSGAGPAALCLLARVPSCRVTGIEVQAGSVSAARRNAVLNGLDDRASFVVGDITAADPLAGLRFDHSFANPPYFATGQTSFPATAARRLSRHAPPDLMPAWLDYMATHTRRGGSITLIQRSERLPGLLALLAGVGATALLPLWPGRERAAKLCLVQTRVGEHGAFHMLPGLTLHANGGYTAAAEAILRDAAGLRL
ncbi:MAG: methyltransferase [Alphaproteobacteria bacterium]|nr:methyltransferase [Alphaproteobacteria bacterium]